MCVCVCVPSICVCIFVRAYVCVRVSTDTGDFRIFNSGIMTISILLRNKIISLIGLVCVVLCCVML